MGSPVSGCAAGWEGVVLAYVTGSASGACGGGSPGVRTAGTPLAGLRRGDVPLQPGGGGLPSGPGLQDPPPGAGWGWSAREIRERLPRVRGVTLQEEEKQGEFKASFLFDPRAEPALREDPALADAPPRRWSGVWIPSPGRGSWIVLPPGGGEGGRTPVSPGSACPDPGPGDLTRGDSGNDRDALLQGGFGILMANAPGEPGGGGPARRPSPGDRPPESISPGTPSPTVWWRGSVTSGGSGRRRGAPHPDTLEDVPGSSASGGATAG